MGGVAVSEPAVQDGGERLRAGSVRIRLIFTMEKFAIVRSIICRYIPDAQNPRG
jgi:hypothetical protein